MGKIFTRDNLQLLLVIAIIVAAIALSRLFSASRTLPERQVDETPLAVTVSTVERGENVIPVLSTGRVLPRSTVSITPQVSGRVEWVSENLYGGGFLEAGQALFRIEAVDYENTVARERAQLAQARTDLALEEAEAEAAVAEWQALNADTEVPALVSRAPQIAQARAQLAAAEARLAQAELDLSRTLYRLPFSGRVVSSTLEIGEFVVAGNRYGEIYNQDSLEIVLSLSQNDLYWLRRGAADEIGVAINFALPGEPQGRARVEGRVLRFGAILDENTRFQEVVIKPIGDGSLLPGMLTEVEMRGIPVADTWRLPITAIQAGQDVWQVDAEGKLRRLQPEILKTLTDTVIVRLPLDLDKAAFVNGVVSGGVEGLKVRVVIDPEGSADGG
ncbi:MAG TPA: hypothetical protein DIT58_15550 [Porticoccaceae bacterium]|nr:hypothetical protein [Porticoccaceae bacterium]